MAAHSISTLTIRDCRIRLMRGGAGAPLVFLHGGGGIGIWLPSMARLAKKFDVIAPEHPGFGDSDMPAWLDTVGDLAQLLSRFSRSARPARRPSRRQLAGRLDRRGSRGPQ